MRTRFLSSWLFEHAERTPAARAVATPLVRLSYGELAARVRALAGHLAASGVSAGDRVLVALPTLAATAVSSLAVDALGACSVEVNRDWGASSFGAILEKTGVRHVFAAGRDAHAWGEVAAGFPIDRFWVVHSSQLSGTMVSAFRRPSTWIDTEGTVDPDVGAPPAYPEPARRRAEAPAVILYTSGSTGRPRGVVQTSANIDANTRSIVEYLDLGPEDRMMSILPLYYCYGRSLFQTHLFVGGSTFHDDRFMYPRVVMEAIGAEGCTGFAGVPMTYELLRRHVNPRAIAMPKLRYLMQAGGPMAPDTIRWVREAFRPARLFVMYGQTEATARLSYLPPERGEDKHGSIGIAIPGVELRVVDEAGRDLPPGATGHLVARGNSVTPGYLGEPEATAEVLHDGWLWTGDLARQDEDGFLFLAGRVKEILKIAGHRVSPAEIEQAIARHPDVIDAAVVGARSELVGDAVVAFVVPRAESVLDEAAVRRFCRERLPLFKVPSRVVFVDALPRNESGKLLRVELKAQADALEGGA
jgi:long-chain acyl-CoA synthetase